MVETDIERQIRVLVKEELEKELGEIREQISSLSLRIDEIEREPSKKWNLIPKLRKHTTDDLMSEYHKIKEETHQKTEEQADI